MNVNRGKQFEDIVKQAFLKVPDVSIDRLHDQTTGYLGSKNICDFIVYREPYELYLECKTIHGNTFPLSNITDNQMLGLLEKSKINGVYAGVLIWWVDKDVTKYIPIDCIVWNKKHGFKSLRYDHDGTAFIEIKGKKKRVFFEYDMEEFLNEIQHGFHA